MPEDTSKWRGFELAVAGTNLSPADIPARQLVELIEAAMQTVELIAEERGAAKPRLRLIGVTTGSAAYQLRTPDPADGPVIDELARQVETRGVHASPAVRQALARLNHAGKNGSVRLRVVAKGGVKRKKDLFVAPPVELVGTPYEETAEVVGRLVGVNAGRSNALTIRLRLDDGITREFAVEQDIAARAGKLFLQMVLARVTYDIGPDSMAPGEALDICPCEMVDDGEFLREIELARKKISGVGTVPSASEWLRSLEHDE